MPACNRLDRVDHMAVIVLDRRKWLQHKSGCNYLMSKNDYKTVTRPNVVTVLPFLDTKKQLQNDYKRLQEFVNGKCI